MKNSKQDKLHVLCCSCYCRVGKLKGLELLHGNINSIVSMRSECIQLYFENSQCLYRYGAASARLHACPVSAALAESFITQMLTLFCVSRQIMNKKFWSNTLNIYAALENQYNKLSNFFSRVVFGILLFRFFFSPMLTRHQF